MDEHQQCIHFSPACAQWKMEFKSKAYILMIFTLLSVRVAVATVQTLFNQLHSTNYICSAYLLDGRKKKKLAECSLLSIIQFDNFVSYISSFNVCDPKRTHCASCNIQSSIKHELFFQGNS